MDGLTDAWPIRSIITITHYRNISRLLQTYPEVYHQTITLKARSKNERLLQGIKTPSQGLLSAVLGASDVLNFPGGDEKLYISQFSIYQSHWPRQTLYSKDTQINAQAHIYIKYDASILRY